MVRPGLRPYWPSRNRTVSSCRPDRSRAALAGGHESPSGGCARRRTARRRARTPRSGRRGWPCARPGEQVLEDAPAAPTGAGRWHLAAASDLERPETGDLPIRRFVSRRCARPGMASGPGWGGTRALRLGVGEEEVGRSSLTSRSRDEQALPRLLHVVGSPSDPMCGLVQADPLAHPPFRPSRSWHPAWHDRTAASPGAGRSSLLCPSAWLKISSASASRHPFTHLRASACALRLHDSDGVSAMHAWDLTASGHERRAIRQQWADRRVATSRTSPESCTDACTGTYNGGRSDPGRSRLRGWEGASVDFGVLMFVTDFSLGAVDFAREAEDLGFDMVLLPEHTHIPTSRAEPVARRRRRCRASTRTRSTRSWRWARRRPSTTRLRSAPASAW